MIKDLVIVTNEQVAWVKPASFSNMITPGPPLTALEFEVSETNVPAEGLKDGYYQIYYEIETESEGGYGEPYHEYPVTCNRYFLKPTYKELFKILYWFLLGKFYHNLCDYYLLLKPVWCVTEELSSIGHSPFNQVYLPKAIFCYVGMRFFGRHQDKRWFNKNKDVKFGIEPNLIKPIFKKDKK